MRFDTNEQLLETLTRQKLERATRRRPVTQNQLTQAVRQILRRAEEREAEGRDQFSFARAIRGVMAMKHQPIVMEWAQSDAEYVQRAMTTGTQPGQFLIPTMQAGHIIGQLAQLATARAAGCRVWPCAGIQDLNVPAAIGGAPQFVWLAQNSKQTPSDPNATQIAFDLKLSQALILMPVQLFRTALPQWDVILEESLALGCAEAEDQAMHASSTLSVDAPKALMSQPGITTLNAANNAASGGNLLYADLLALLQKVVDLKVRSPLAWFMAGRTWLRCLSLNDAQSRPVVIPAAEGDGLQLGHLLGWPVYGTTSISTAEVVGSGSNQSHAILTNPKAAIHVADAGEVTLAASTDFALDTADVAVRVGHRVAFGYQPSAAICVLQGIN